jgi:hypothetical protein
MSGLVVKPVLSTPRADVYCAGFEDVAPRLPDGLASLAILDGYSITSRMLRRLRSSAPARPS